MRKKSVIKACEEFLQQVEEIDDFLSDTKNLSDQRVSWVHDYAIIRLYRAFENFILSCLICAINNDTEQLSEATDIRFPSHLTDEVCEYIICGNGYFDFKGRSGLIKTVKQFVPDEHYLLEKIRDPKYKDTLERLSALRNYAAHDGPVAKRRAMEAVSVERMASAGSWLKKQNRFTKIQKRLCDLATAIKAEAPY